MPKYIDKYANFDYYDLLEPKAIEVVAPVEKEVIVKETKPSKVKIVASKKKKV